MISKNISNDSVILFVGDIHVGRRPETLAAQLQGHGIQTHELSSATAWAQVIEHAIEINAVAVVLAGDIIDREEDLIEAYYTIERGAQRLQEASIPLIAIAGNHDATLLPQLARNVQGVQLLGEGGTWSSTKLQAGTQTVELLGWSFPSTHYNKNPLHNPTLNTLLEIAHPSSAKNTNARRIMIVHGDLDVASSHYAPMKRAEIEALPIDAAFLGHIHSPDPLDGHRPIGYLGSLVGLDAGETGAHGPVEVRIRASGGIVATRIPMAPIRWEILEVDVTSTSTRNAEALRMHITEHVSEWANETALHPSMKVLSLRIVLTGRRELEGWHDALHALSVDPSRALLVDGIRAHVLVERYVDRTRLAFDLASIARERTPAGRLARFLTQPIDPEMRRISRELLESTWTDESLRMPEPYDVEEALKQAAHRTLERMLDARAHGEHS